MDVRCSFFITAPLRGASPAAGKQRETHPNTKKRGIFMNRSITRRQFLKASGLAAVGTCAAGLLSSCGGSSSGSGAASGSAASGTGSSYTILYDSQPSTLNYLTTASDLKMQVPTAWIRWWSTTTRA